MTTNMTGGGNLTKLGQTLNNLKAAGRKGLIVYITAGCPDYPASLAAVLAAAAAGADVVEVGMPFSDPLADGPVIQKAAAFALKAGATTAKTLDMIRQIGRQSAVPLAVMTYTNTVLQYDAAKFARDFAARFGVRPDYAAAHAYESARMLAAAIRAAGLNRARIRDALRDLSPWTGAAVHLRWDPLGQNQGAVVPATIRKGVVSPVSPPVLSPAADPFLPHSGPR